MHVSLAEALEVRGGPLLEEEVWALLSQSTESLQELLQRDHSPLGFIISPWSLLLSPSGNITFTDENVTQQDLRAFTAPEVLEGLTLASISDVEKMHMYSLGMTLFWGADYQIPQSQPMKLGEHLNSVLLNMCDDSTLGRLSVRTVLDVCSKHIRSSSCEPPFSYVRRLVRLVLGSLSQLDGLLTDRESLPERSKEIRERLRGKGLPSGRSAAPRVLERYRARTQEVSLGRGLSRSMGSLCPPDLLQPEGGGEVELQASRPPAPPLAPARGRPVELDRRSLPYRSAEPGQRHARKVWASSVDLASMDPDALRFGALEDARRGSSALSTRSAGRRASRDREAPWDWGVLEDRKLHHHSALSLGSNAYERIREKQRTLQVLRQAMDDPLHTHRRYQSDFSSSSDSPSVTSSDPEYRQARKPEEGRGGGPHVGLLEHDALSLSRHRLYDGVQEEVPGAELLLQRQEVEVQRLQAQLASRLSRSSLYPPGEDVQGQPRRHRGFGPEFVRMSSEPTVQLVVPSSIMNKRGRVEVAQRVVGVQLLSGQRLELTCDLKAVSRDLLDMVTAHLGLVEHHLFALATLRDNEFFFVDPEAKLSKVAPEGWKEEQKKKKGDVPFNLFLRIKFFLDDVTLIQHLMTKHQYYLQLRKDILEERVRCDAENAMLLASLALQAEFGDYQPELHGKTYFRLEHYLPGGLLDKMDNSSIKTQLPKLHSNYYGATEAEAELEFLKVSQRLAEYGVHFHRVLPEKRSQTGVLLAVSSKGVLIFEVLNGNRTPVLRFPWRDTKKISFTKKKICLQNTSDEIKHLFQTDSAKTCQYLLSLCSQQHKFHLHSKAWQNQQELQELERSPLAGLPPPPRTLSSGSLAPSSSGRSDSTPLKRLSYSELALNHAPPARLLSQEQLLFPGFNPGVPSHPRLMSRSHHNLGQVLESPERRAGGGAYSSQSQSTVSRSQLISQPRASSDTESLSASQQQESFSSPAWSLLRARNESDSSSMEDSGHAYVVGVSMHGSSGPPSTPALSVSDSLKKRLSALPSPEREITSVTLKKDVKYGLGFQVVGGGGSGRLDLGTFISSITPGGPADVHGGLKPGDRLISVNDMNLEGLPHSAAIEALSHAPDDVTLVVSQPKDQLYQESASGVPPYQTPPPSVQREEEDLESSSEEKAGVVSPSSPLLLPKAISSAPSSPLHPRSPRTSTAASLHRNPDGTIVVVANPPEPPPPALPPKTRKAKVVEAPKEPEYSDRGDSDMDEDTCSSSQEKLKLRKECIMGNLSGNDPGVTSLRPGDLYDVELSKQDSSLGISVTGGANTNMKHGGVYVKAIIPRGAAEQDGRIQKGDRVVAVNGRSLEGATHREAVEALRDTGQLVRLLLEKGSPPDSVHAPLTPQSTPPPSSQTRPRDPPAAQYSFVTQDNVFSVSLLKNSSGLGFSFSREEQQGGEGPGASMVRVKKLFPGQPAAESSRISVGDVILRVNQTALRGLSQHEVISALRGTGQEVTLLLCRPKPGVLPDMDTSALTPLASPRKDPSVPPDPPQQGSPPVRVGGAVEEALQRLLLKTPPKGDWDSDSSEGGGGRLPHPQCHPALPPGPLPPLRLLLPQPCPAPPPCPLR